MAKANASSARDRAVAEENKKPTNIGEWAKRSQVLPRYMAGGFWHPGGRRRGSLKGN